MGEVVRSEDELGRKWDRCMTDAAVKTVTGLGLGVVFSVLFFKRRPWPVSLGTGIGLGMSYANCQHDFLHPKLIHGQIKMIEKAKPVKTEEKCENCEDGKKK